MAALVVEKGRFEQIAGLYGCLDKVLKGMQLYAGLLEVADQLYAQADAGQAPSLRPLRRVLQMIIDGVRQSGGIYQMLSVVGETGAATSRAQLRAGVSVDAVGFGQYAGLPSGDLMTLALAGLLGGIAQGETAEEALRPLFRYGGLGEAAVPLALTLRDARAAQAGGRAGVPGGIAKLFALYKGRFPLGPLVRLSEGRLAVVLSQGADEAGKAQPQLGLLSPAGKLAGRLDLRQRGDVRIVEVLSPDQVAVRLADL